MQYLIVLLKLDRNPLLPILLVLAAFVALAPDFEVPQSSPAGHDAKLAQSWPAHD